jgi:Asp/Glu/hydantoin racemase
MTRRLVLLHTVPGLIPAFRDLADELLPDDVELANVVDETLLKDAIAGGGVSASINRRVMGHVVSARDAGAVAVLATCSSIGPAVELARALSDIPVLRVDDPMADEAVELGGRIGVVATLQSTLEPTTALVRARAHMRGRDVDVVSRLCEGAFDAVARGDGARHDELVRSELRSVASEVDAIVLAQASTARVASSMAPDAIKVPVLSSPRSGLQQAVELLERAV